MTIWSKKCQHKWYVDGNNTTSDRRINDLSVIVYDFVRVLSRSHSVTVSNILSNVKKRVDKELSVYKSDDVGTVELVHQYADKGTQTDVDNCTVGDDLHTSFGDESNELNAAIVNNIKSFLTPARKGPITSATSA